MTPEVQKISLNNWELEIGTNNDGELFVYAQYGDDSRVVHVQDIEISVPDANWKGALFYTDEEITA